LLPLPFFLFMLSNDAIDAALVRELCSGRQLMESLEKRREIEAAAEARAMRESKSMLGTPVGSIPQREYLLLANKYGNECWDDREFVRDFFKSQGHLKAGNI
jgi:hypothetical protein